MEWCLIAKIGIVLVGGVAGGFIQGPPGAALGGIVGFFGGIPLVMWLLTSVTSLVC